jgi:hypothetical protein
MSRHGCAISAAVGKTYKRCGTRSLIASLRQSSLGIACTFIQQLAGTARGAAKLHLRFKSEVPWLLTVLSLLVTGKFRSIQGSALSLVVFRACVANPVQLLYKPTTSPEGRGNVAPWGRPERVRWPGCRTLRQLPERTEPHLIFCFFCIKAKEGLSSLERDKLSALM